MHCNRRRLGERPVGGQWESRGPRGVGRAKDPERGEPRTRAFISTEGNDTWRSRSREGEEQRAENQESR